MRLAALLRHRRLLMQFDPPKGPAADRLTNLKRQHVRHAQTHAYAINEGNDDSRPYKTAKLAPLTSAYDMPSSSSSNNARRGGSSSSRPTRGGGQPAQSSSRRKANTAVARKPPSAPSIPTLEGPKRDQAYIKTLSQHKIKPSHEDNPKSPLANFCTHVNGSMPHYEATEGLVDGRKVIRVTVSITHAQGVIIGEGDAGHRKDAERLAALSAVYQLNNLGILENPSKVAGSKAGSTASSGGDGKTQTLSDGTTVNYDQARQFMDWYCRRFGFPKEDITWEEVASGAKRRSQSSVWEAVMSVDNRRIGIGKGNNKKAAMTACYLDVTQYLESCDADLWKTFLAAAKSGKDLGMAPKVWLQMSDRLDDDVRDLCHDIKQSHLYKNRPVSTASTAANTAPASKRARFPASVQALETKSQRLKERRVAYEANPALQKMRTTRASLPVFTRAEEIIKHIDEHEVTICMAATGSGKTTQIPQIVLDDWIAKNKGAQCNIVCTQPRRLAAISVADRVAKERGEVVGQGSVGYQVRFEQKMAEDHGSITFCTIGIFLKRMQSALLEGGDSGGHNLDDVTHVIVDEVHERDVDTDLLLVVLKRLLDDRRARGKPIKVVLMSATIDPTLFQKYFPDAKGEPAQVIDIPGRSFPVTKHFLDDFLVDMSKARIARQVFQDKDVNKYLQSELSPDTLRAIGVPYQPESRAADEDSAVPAPLIAMTIAHVLGQSDSGHVLTFLPGWDDIMTVNRFLEEQGHSLGYNFKDSSKFTIHMLHSSVPLAEQQVIFEPPKEGVRRIILATNIAETSVTIPDVVYVVDSGKVKEQRYDPDRHMSSLVSAWIGGSNLNQRAGRAGRHRPGEYFGVLSRSRMEKLSPYQTVEMKRVDLSNVVMHVKALNFPGMSVEDVLAATIEPPADVRVAAAMQDLRMVGALDKDKNLTSLGRVLLQLPIEAQMGRMVLFGSFFRCLDSALTLAAILTNRDPFLAPMHLKDQAAAKKNYWVPVDHRSDVLATVSAYNAWWELQSTGQYVRANAFCSENFLSKPTLLTIQKIRVHLLQALRQAGVLDISGGGGTYHPPGRRRDDSVPAELNRNGDSLPLLTSLIAIASQPNFGLRVGNAYRTQQDKQVFIHPSSVNHKKRDEDGTTQTLQEKQLIAFAEKRQNVSTGSTNPQKFIVTTTRLDPVAYILFGAYEITVTDRGLECDDWLPIVGNIDALDDIQRLKYLMEASLQRVFEGITYQRHRQRSRRDMIPIAREEEREDEADDDDDVSQKDRSLSPQEIKDLDLMTTDIVRVLNHAADERIAGQSRQNSRPASPMGSPLFGSNRLAGTGGSGSGSRSGTSTPYGRSGMNSAFNSRPGTPGVGPSPLRKW